MSILTSKFVRNEIFNMHRLLKANSFLSDVLPLPTETLERVNDQTVVHKGLFGGLLETLDDRKHADVLEKFGRTPAGAALLAYAYERDVDIKKSYVLNSTGAYGRKNSRHVKDGNGEVLLNAHADEAGLMMILAHEIRHVWQHDRVGKLFGDYTPPDAMLAISRVVEADAYLFQKKFAEDYAEKTGDKRLIDVAMKGIKSLFPNAHAAMQAGKSDEECFFTLMQDLGEEGGYDKGMIARAQILLEHDDGKRKLVSPEVSGKLTHAVATMIDNTWPLKDRYGRENYLDRRSDKPTELAAKDRLLSTKVSGLGLSALDDVKKSYQEAYSAQKKPAPSSLKAPGLK